MGKKASGQGPTDYVIGRGKPPQHSQYRPGQSGNPGGRKRGSLNVQTLLEAVLTSEIVLTEQGKTRTVTCHEALYLKLMQMALQGNARSLEFLIGMAERLQRAEQQGDGEISDDDQAIIDAMLARSSPTPARKSIEQPKQRATSKRKGAARGGAAEADRGVKGVGQSRRSDQTDEGGRS